MIISDIVYETPPIHAALEGTCDTCHIEILTDNSEITSLPKQGVLKTWMWIDKCPRCGDLICFTEKLADDYSEADGVSEVPPGNEPYLF